MSLQENNLKTIDTSLDDLPPFRCMECNKKERASKWRNGKELYDKKLCLNCDFWYKRIDLCNRENNHSIVVIDRHAYFIGEENPDIMMRGFGGAKFHIRFHDGHEVKSTNLWHNGEIDDRFLDRLPDNAVFLKDKQLATMKWDD